MPTFLDRLKNNQPEPERFGPSLGYRVWGLLRRNPRTLHTFLREAYRQNLGIALERRFRQGRSGLPALLNLSLTRQCNLNCLMCMQLRKSDRDRTGMSWLDPARDLPLNAWTTLLDQAMAFRPRIYITGGEPLLYPYFKEFLQEAKERGLQVHLQTNGTRLADVAELLVARGVEMVNVSVDGPEEVHDYIRGRRGAFQRTMKGIQTLIEARRRLKSPGPILVINCVISKDNLAVLDQMVPLAVSSQAEVLQFQHAIFNTPANIARHNAILSPELAQAHGLDLVAPSIPDGNYYQNKIGAEDLPSLIAALQTARRQARGRLKFIVFPNITTELLGPYYLDLDYPFPQLCNALWKLYRVFPDGTVSPCLNVVVGNITEQPLSEIWNGPRMLGFRKLIAQRLFPGCTRCCNRIFT